MGRVQVLIVIFLLLAPFSHLPVSSAAPQTIDVCPGCPFSTISAGVAAAFPGDTISIAAGTYRESVRITKPLTLLGPAAGVPAPGRVLPEATIDAGGLAGVAVTIASTGVTLDGLRILSNERVPVAIRMIAPADVRHVAFFSYDTAIYVEAPTASIAESSFEGAGSYAVYVAGPTSGLSLVRNAIGPHATATIHLAEGPHAAPQVTGNLVEGGPGLVLKDTIDANVSANTVRDASYHAIALPGAAGSVALRANVLDGYAFAGVSVRGDGLASVDVEDIAFAGSSRGYGIDVDAPFATLSFAGNSLAANQVHVYLRGRPIDVPAFVAANELDFHAWVEGGAATDAIAGSLLGVVAHAPAAATVRLSAGRVEESVTLSRPITILGANAGVPPGPGRGPETLVEAGATPAITVLARNVTISGVAFAGGLANGTAVDAAGAHGLRLADLDFAVPGAAVRIRGSTHASVETSRFSGGIGLVATSTRALVVRASQFEGAGLEVRGSDDARVEDARFVGGGAAFVDSRNATLLRAAMEAPVDGVRVVASEGVLLERLRVRDAARDAVRLEPGGALSTGIEIHNATFENSAGAALNFTSPVSALGIVRAPRAWWGSADGPLLDPLGLVETKPPRERIRGIGFAEIVPWCEDEACSTTGPFPGGVSP